MAKQSGKKIRKRANKIKNSGEFLRNKSYTAVGKAMRKTKKVYKRARKK